MNLLIKLPLNSYPSKAKRFISKISHGTLQCYKMCFIGSQDVAFCKSSQRVKDSNYFQKSSILETLKIFFKDILKWHEKF